MTCADHSPSEWPAASAGDDALLGENARGRYAHRHDGRLRVFGQAQIFFRPFETEL